jgi:hypothetical protein
MACKYAYPVPREGATYRARAQAAERTTADAAVRHAVVISVPC